MIQALAKTLTLQEFLQQPETKPAREYINGEIIQKPMAKGRHSRLQGKLCATINQISENTKIAYGFPELRCSFGARSTVPDVSVFRWERIPFTELPKLKAPCFQTGDESSYAHSAVNKILTLA